MYTMSLNVCPWQNGYIELTNRPASLIISCGENAISSLRDFQEHNALSLAGVTMLYNRPSELFSPEILYSLPSISYQSPPLSLLLAIPFACMNLRLFWVPCISENIR